MLDCTPCREHAADVVRSLYCLFTLGGVARTVWPEAQEEAILAAIFAATVHDFEHKGLNNDFLIKTQDPLAVSHTE